MMLERNPKTKDPTATSVEYSFRSAGYTLKYFCWKNDIVAVSHSLKKQPIRIQMAEMFERRILKLLQ